MNLAAAVYVLCFLTSVLCAVLLLRGFAQSKAKLLLWSGLCFACFALNNALLVVDRLLLPSVDLFWVRSAPTVVGMLLLMYGLIWESE